MNREDHNLATILQYENIAWYSDGEVKILDRRVYPMKLEYVACKTYDEVAQAITDMVTQSGGPYLAASMGMVLASYQSLELPKTEREEFLKTAAHRLQNARPTTSSKMTAIVNGSLEVALQFLNQDDELVNRVFNCAIDEVNSRYAKMKEMGKLFSDSLKDGSVVMTQCFPDAIIGMVVRRLKETNKTNVQFYCPETRPYLQGARLTASIIKEMGFEVTVISDNMCAFTMQQKKVDVCLSAADVITMDGYVVNKVGTFQIALAANHLGIPYFCLGLPNKKHATIETVEIEVRDGEDVLGYNGVKVTYDGVQGYYPSFDITPPQLCSGIITDTGIYSPFLLNS